MRATDVPQDNIDFYQGQKKAIYAVLEDGKYGIVGSTGWKIETDITNIALQEYIRLAQEALIEVNLGNKSPLYFHMYNNKMELALLSGSTGIAKWKIRRHFKPKIFKRLNEKKLGKYADSLGITINELTSIIRSKKT
jgi:hypothetical protein